jgi:hypothetical protein
MKAILEFKLPEEVAEYTDAVDGTNWKLVVCDLDRFLRDKIKYDNDLTKEELDIYTSVRDNLYEIISSKELFLN